MIRFVGLDVHRRSVVAHIADATGKRLLELTVACTRPDLQDFARRHLTSEDQVVLEATGTCWPVLSIIRPFVGKITAANSLLVRAIAHAKVKTDKIDARVLANLLRCGYLPEVWTPDAATQLLRTLTHRRAILVAERTRCKNRIRAVLANELLPRYEGDIAEAKGRAYLTECDLSPTARRLVDSDLRLLDATESELCALEQELVMDAAQNPRAQLLMTLPGVDYDTALTVLAALGDVSRFKDPDHAAAYLGLSPSTRQSGAHCYHGPITKRGNSKARWMLVQATQRMDINPGPLGVFFRRLARKKNRNVAVVATARKLVVIAWHMLKNNEPYRYALPAPTRAKLITLRTKATGQRRASGPPKGTPRSARYGSGQGVRRIPALSEVYEQEGLPPATGIEQLAPAERRALKEQQVDTFVAAIQLPAEMPKKAHTNKSAHALSKAGGPTRSGGRACLTEEPHTRQTGYGMALQNSTPVAPAMESSA